MNDTIKNSILTIFGSAAVSWIGIYIKTKLDQRASKGYYTKMYKKNMQTLFFIVTFIPLVFLVGTASEYSVSNNKNEITIFLWCVFIIAFVVFSTLTYFVFFKKNKKKFDTKLMYQVDLLHGLFMYYAILQFMFFILLYCTAYNKFGFKPDEAWILILLLSMLSGMISICVYVFGLDRLKFLFFQDTYKKIESTYKLYKKRGYFYVNERMLTDHMMFCLSNDFFYCRLPLHKLVEISGKERRAVFFSENTVNYFEFQYRKKAIKRLKEAKKNGNWKTEVRAGGL